jgi:integrase
LSVSSTKPNAAATQSINNGMSLEAIAQMLGHRSMRMTLVYARIADRTVADEYFAAAAEVDQLYTTHLTTSPA